MNYDTYSQLKRRIAPGLRFNQEIYEDVVSAHVTRDAVWLDAGCGWHVFPPWREESEHEVTGRAKLVLGCDVDEVSVRQHRSIRRVSLADLSFLPIRTGSVDVVTCNMVVEHLESPEPVFAEFARVLTRGGRLIVHTPNAWSHFVAASKCVPKTFKTRLAQRLDGRAANDIFPTLYRANTPRRIRALMTKVGLREEWLRMLASDATLGTVHPVLAVAELALIRLTLMDMFRGFRVSILASYAKP
jgi:ubiquinone/menaquinone biosynthesis C-methylase UbiE